MLIDEVPIEKKFIRLLKSTGISVLYPPQEALVRDGIFGDMGNLILSTPTASGKTLAAELAMIKALETGEKAVYVVPLRALAYEKFLEFQKYRSVGFNVRLEMGDLDSSKYRKTTDFDILVTTAEKCDSILRSRPHWFDNIGVLVMDEIHLIASDRGPVYEILISKFQRLFPGIRVLALSATIGNAGELAGWLNAKLIASTWRPVELLETVEVGGNKYDKLREVVSRSLSGGGQVLVFVNSRRSAASVAQKLGDDLRLGVAENAKETARLEKDVLSAFSSPTKQCRRLGGCLRNGTAFHHAGIANKQRILVEDAFKRGVVKVIVATPTLAAGVNLPSRTVILRDVKRYGQEGLNYIPVLEYKQQVGRAGRPGFDDIGMAVTIARTESERDFLVERYVNGEVEPIHSRLGVEPVLRFHILAAIASGFTGTSSSLLEFFSSTFFGYQYGLGGFEALIDRIIDGLMGWDFIKKEGNFLLPTPLGARVSELYIDPLTARNYISVLNLAESQHKFPALGLLEMLCDAVEIYPLYLNRQEEALLWEEAYKVSDELFRDLGGFELDPGFLERFKTAKLFMSWINESSEEDILESYNVAPGILNQRLQNAQWLSYSAGEISRILGLGNAAAEMRKLEARIKYGIREELIPLVSVKGIGRIRARKLFNAGVVDPSHLKKKNMRKLKALLGEKTAERILET